MFEAYNDYLGRMQERKLTQHQRPGCVVPAVLFYTRSERGQLEAFSLVVQLFGSKVLEEWGRAVISSRAWLF